MKVKILGETSYQTYPETIDMVNIEEEDLKEIGITKKFENGQIVHYEANTKIIETKKQRLTELTKDFAQVEAGLVIDDLEERRAEFRTLLNEVRVLQGKEKRKIEE